MEVWRHVVELGKTIDPNIRWVWSPNRANEYSAPYYPGDDYVDYIGITMNLPADKADQYADFLDYYTEVGMKENLEQYGKRIIISELAFSDDAAGGKGAYLQSVFDAYAEDGAITLIAFFNDDVSPTRQYRITDEESGLFYQRPHSRGGRAAGSVQGCAGPDRPPETE